MVTYLPEGVVGGGRASCAYVCGSLCLQGFCGLVKSGESTFPRKVRVDFALDHQRGLGKESRQTVWSVASCHEISQWTSSGSDPQHNA